MNGIVTMVCLFSSKVFCLIVNSVSICLASSLVTHLADLLQYQVKI